MPNKKVEPRKSEAAPKKVAEKRTIIYRAIIPDAISRAEADSIRAEAYALVGRANEGNVKTVVRGGKKYKVTRVVAARVPGIDGLIPATQHNLYSIGAAYQDQSQRSGLEMIAYKRKSGGRYYDRTEIRKPVKELCVVEYVKELE